MQCELRWLPLEGDDVREQGPGLAIAHTGQEQRLLDRTDFQMQLVRCERFVLNNPLLN